MPRKYAGLTFEIIPKTANPYQKEVYSIGCRGSKTRLRLRISTRLLFGKVFSTTNEDLLINAIEQVHRDDLWNQRSCRFTSNIFTHYMTRPARQNREQTEWSVVSTLAAAGLSISWSEGSVVSNGQNTVTVVPEPATLSILGISALTLLR